MLNLRIDVILASGVTLALAAVGTSRACQDGRAAIIAGKPLQVAELDAALMEAAGGLVLEEAVLDAAIAGRLALAGVQVLPADIERERLSLVESLRDEAGASDEQAGVLLEGVRRSRGLGPVRFEALLRRNAGLRALVGELPPPEAADVKRAMAIEFGPRCRARVLTVESPAEANTIRLRLSQVEKPEHLAVLFAGEAAAHSTDSARNAGGLLVNVSPDEPGVSGALRPALQTLEPGRVSEVLGVERGYSLVLVESRTQGREPTAAERTKVEAKLRQRMARVAMDRLAREMLDEAKPIILDASLRWSWENPPR